jgi:hypothetical protein
VADAKARAKERERPQITVATVIQKPGKDVNEGVISNMNEKSKEIQVLGVLRKHLPKEKVLAMFDDLMSILRKGGTNRERKKIIVLKREKKAPEAQKAVRTHRERNTIVLQREVKIAEAQKVVEAEKDIAKKTAEEEMKAAEEVERERRLKQETDTVAAEVQKFFAAQEERRKQETDTVAEKAAKAQKAVRTHRGRRETIVKREAKAVEDVKVAAEAQKAIEAEKNIGEKAAKEEREETKRAVKVRKKTAAIAVETVLIATQKVAEEVTIECEKCNTLSIAEAVTRKVCSDCLWIPAVVAKDRFVQKSQKVTEAEKDIAEKIAEEIKANEREAEIKRKWKKWNTQGIFPLRKDRALAFGEWREALEKAREELWDAKRRLELTSISGPLWKVGIPDDLRRKFDDDFNLKRQLFGELGGFCCD